MKYYILRLFSVACMLSGTILMHAQSDLQVLHGHVQGTQAHMTLDPFGVQSAIDSLTVLISTLEAGASSGATDLDVRIDSLAGLVTMLDSAQTLGTTGQVLQISGEDGSEYLNWVDISNTAGTGITLTGDEFSIGQPVATTDDVTFDDISADSLSATGSLNVSGKTFLKDSLIITGGASISRSLSADSIATTDVTSGTFNASGKTTLGDSLIVNGSSTISGSLLVDSIAASDVTSATLNATGKTTLGDSLIVNGNSTISGSLLVDSIAVTDVINGQVGSLSNHNLDALNDVPGMGSPGTFLRVKSDSSGLEYGTTPAYTAGTGLTLTDSQFSIGQPVDTTDNVTFKTLTADSLFARVTFIDSASIGQQLVVLGNTSDDFFVIGAGDPTQQEQGPFGGSFIASYIDNAVSRNGFNHSETAVETDAGLVDLFSSMSTTGIQGSVGAVQGQSFTGHGLRESYLGTSQTSLLESGSFNDEEGPGSGFPQIGIEGALSAALVQVTSQSGGASPLEASQIYAQVYSELVNSLPVEASVGLAMSNENQAPGDSTIVALESKVAEKNSAFSAYQSSGLRNVRQIYQNATNADSLLLDTLDFTTTEAIAVLQTYNDEYVDFEYLEMTAQDSGLTVTHDDYGIALSTGTRYEQATDSTVTRISASAGLEMHGESGKAVLYADTIEFRGAVDFYGDLNLSNVLADNLIEQNFGSAELTLALSGDGSTLVVASETTHRIDNIELVNVPPGMTIQPENEDYTYSTPGDGWVEITGAEAFGDYFLEVVIESKLDPNTSPTGDNNFISHSTGILRGDSGNEFSWAPIEQCQVTNHYLRNEIATQQFSCFLHHHDPKFLYSIFYTNGSDLDRLVSIMDIEIRKVNQGEFVDQFPPYMTITATQGTSGDISNVGTLDLTFLASEAIDNFDASYITATNGTISNFAGSGLSYTATFTAAGDGACAINVASDSFQDDFENDNIASQFTWNIDTVDPVVTIAAAAGGIPGASGNTSNDASLNLTFTLSESPTSFEQADITSTNGTISGFNGSGLTYTATFTPNVDGSSTIDVNSNAFQDAAGNGNEAATQYTWNFDTVGPSVTIAADEVSSDQTSTDGTLSLTFTVSESTESFAEGDIAGTNGTISNFNGSGLTYTATFTPTGFGVCTIKVAGSTFTDAAGNNNTAADQFNWTYSDGSSN